MEILESIVEVTAQRDRESLEASLVMALAELVEADSIRLFNVRQDATGITLVTSVDYQVATQKLRDEPKPEQPLADDPLLQQVYQDKASRFFAEQRRYVQPVVNELDQVIALLDLSGSKESPPDARLDILLKIYLNYLRLIEESTRDTLTGLLNRKTFDTCLHQILQRQKQEALKQQQDNDRRHSAQQHGHWLAVADIDHFKHINDTFGHLFGDEVLVLITRIMCDTLRTTDKLFRFGGEEFIILLTADNARGAATAFERLRQKVADYPFPQLDRVTISLGFVRVGAQDVPATVVGHADQALYYAKEHGRNQVCSYDELVAAGKLTADKDTLDEADVELF